jgi:3-deoxy-D-manno-octulosonate 8-phosphate phosphatase (KDO 8-P phosphatase)
MPEDLAKRMRELRLMIFDVDGVLTDGTLYLSDSGVEMKAFNVRDGHGLKMLKESGVQVALLSARRSRAVEMRAAELGITLVEQGAADKGASFDALLARVRIPSASAGYMGDDMVDLPVLVRCGFAASVPGHPADVERPAKCASSSCKPRILLNGRSPAVSDEDPPHPPLAPGPDVVARGDDAVAAIRRSAGYRRREGRQA